MTRQRRIQEYTLAAKNYTLTRNKCARYGARFMLLYLCQRKPQTDNANETPHSSPHKPWNEKFPENAT